MSTLAEQLRDALADYRKADDRGDADLRQRAFVRLHRVHDAIQRAARHPEATR